MNSTLNDFVAKRMPSWVKLRRDLHRYAEPSFMEFRTAAVVAERLNQLGYDVRLGSQVMREPERGAQGAPDLITREKARAIRQGASNAWLERMDDGLTGVVGELKRAEGPILAFRFDMDALLLDESKSPEHRATAGLYASLNEGVMHACGHDGHTTIGLGLAEWLALDTSWRGTVRLIFQPAEETGLGAKSMVATGVVDDVDYFFAAHLGCDLETGAVAAAASHMLCSRKFDVRFTGRSAHAAGNPHEGRNALLAAATATLNLHGIARHPHAETHINVGQLAAGTSRNTVPGKCDMVLEARGETTEVTDMLENRLREIISGAALMHGVEAQISTVGQGLGGKSDVAAADLVAQVCGVTEGVSRVLPSWSLGGSDDAAHFMQRVQQSGRLACYFIIGSDLAAGHHSDEFDFDEDAIGIGVKVYAGIVASKLVVER